jgi:hypothetical protein
MGLKNALMHRCTTPESFGMKKKNQELRRCWIFGEERREMYIKKICAENANK